VWLWLATAFEAAAQTGRRVALVGRSLHRMLEAARACGYIKTDLLLKEEEVKSIPRDELLLVCTGSQGEPRAALARIAARQHPHVKLEEGDTVIFSSRRIPGNEGQIKSVQEALTQRDIILITDRDAHIHVSGHPSRGDLKDMYTWVRPQILIPVHGENTHMREQAKFGLKCGIPQALVPRNGDILAVNAERAGVVDEVTWGRLALDGMELVPNTGPMVKERQKLASAGVVSISVRLVKGRLKEPPQISLLGVVEREVEARVRQEILDNLEMLVDVTPTEKLTNEATLKELISVTVRRALQAFKGKKPLVMSHIFFS
jgi:ribonuclease J